MEYPKIRPVDAFPVQVSGRTMIVLRDPQGLNDQMVFVPQELFAIVRLFDGRHSVRDIQADFMRAYGELLYTEKIQEIVNQLDSCLLLDNERYREHLKSIEDGFRKAKVRLPALSGRGYAADPDELRATLESFFTGQDGPGMPSPERGADGLKGIVAPHIDVRAGGRCFAWAYHVLAQSPRADRCVILGTAHADTRHAYVAAAKDFATPLGTSPLDREFLEGLRALCSFDLFADELAHRAEHSVELQVVFLQYVANLMGWEHVPIVPVLCGSFHQWIEDGSDPADAAEVKEFVGALKELLKGGGGRTWLVASGDLAHIGLRYGDAEPVSEAVVGLVEARDREMLARAEAVDSAGFYRFVQNEKDERHVCGLPCIYTLLAATDATRAQLLRYDYAWMDEARSSFVTFASLALR